VYGKGDRREGQKRRITQKNVIISKPSEDYQGLSICPEAGKKRKHWELSTINL
jgi:hypothetical protein